MAPTKTIIVTVIAKGLFELLTHDFLLCSKFPNNFLSKNFIGIFNTKAIAIPKINGLIRLVI